MWEDWGHACYPNAIKQSPSMCQLTAIRHGRSAIAGFEIGRERKPMRVIRDCIHDETSFCLVPKLHLGTHPPKLCFASIKRPMSRTRCHICENKNPYFTTCTIIGWQAVFTRSGEDACPIFRSAVARLQPGSYSNVRTRLPVPEIVACLPPPSLAGKMIARHA